MAYTFELADLSNQVISDITGIAFDKNLQPQLNRASGVNFRIPL